MLLPEPAKNLGDRYQRSIWEKLDEHTFAVDPQERPIRLPSRKDTSPKEPFGCSPMVDVTCNVVICRWIWWSNPSSKALSQLVP
jgi:hypothetical protein